MHAFISELIKDLKQKLNLDKVMYYSDGAASQYKNYKNLTNLCHHYTDFKIPAEWHFFATSHGKSPCDGIGGTVKRLVARASLQATKEVQILTPIDMYDWSSQHIPGIQFLYISADDIENHETKFKLADRYDTVKTIPGTRSHHAFIPGCDNILTMKRISADAIHSSFQFQQTVLPQENVSNINLGKYVACVYDSEWYIGNVIERCEEERDIYVSFMRKAGNILTWPRREVYTAYLVYC